MSRPRSTSSLMNLRRPAARAGRPVRRVPRPTSQGRQASPASLKTDLALAREEITSLRDERDRLREAVRQQLGQQLDQVSNRQLTDLISELTEQVRQLERSEAQARTEAEQLGSRVAELQADLAAARTSLRKMIRQQAGPPDEQRPRPARPAARRPGPAAGASVRGDRPGCPPSAARPPRTTGPDALQQRSGSRRSGP